MTTSLKSQSVYFNTYLLLVEISVFVILVDKISICKAVTDKFLSALEYSCKAQITVVISVRVPARISSTPFARCL
jgi:hypothetical protein